MKASGKKYTLYSGDVNGEKRPCAFFSSKKGCRNGDSCKFAHTDTFTASANTTNSSTDVISSESSDDEDCTQAVNSSHDLVVQQTHNTKEHNTQVDQNKNIRLKAEMTTLTQRKPESQLSLKEKSATRRKRCAEASDPFVDPKSSDKRVKTTNIAASPHRQSITKAPAGLPSYSTLAVSTSALSNRNMKTPQAEQVTTSIPEISATEGYSRSPLLLAPGSSDPLRMTDLHSLVSESNIDSKVPRSFRELGLPIASFQVPNIGSTSAKKNALQGEQQSDARVTTDIKKMYVTPNSNALGRRWVDLVRQTQNDPRFDRDFDMERYMVADEAVGLSRRDWIKFKPYGAWCSDNPQVIAIDCEMCETVDPVSGEKNPNALCRLSVIDAETSEVLLDTLVKPNWPVSDYRTFINGITETHLSNVQFSLRHAQAYMMALCSEETVIIGQSVHFDLSALKIKHSCVVDSSYLFKSADAAKSTVGLKDLSLHLFHTKMPDIHDSVNDARVALNCVKHYKERNGNVDDIPSSNSAWENYSTQLFVHRIPRDACNESQLSNMFIRHTDVKPATVEDIDFSNKDTGKTIVIFRTSHHANLAFDTLQGPIEIDTTGRKQKKVYLRSGGFIKVRKMAHDKISKTLATANKNIMATIHPVKVLTPESEM